MAEKREAALFSSDVQIYEQYAVWGYTIEDVAEKLNISPSEVSSLLNRGVLRGKRYGSLWMINATALEKFEDTVAVIG